MLWPQSEYTRCDACGTSIAPEALPRHRCDARQQLDHIVRTAAREIGSFEHELAEYLRSPRGRFDAYYWSRRRVPR